jgi:hypothetical protein
LYGKHLVELLAGASKHKSISAAWQAALQHVLSADLLLQAQLPDEAAELVCMVLDAQKQAAAGTTEPGILLQCAEVLRSLALRAAGSSTAATQAAEFMLRHRIAERFMALSCKHLRDSISRFSDSQARQLMHTAADIVVALGRDSMRCDLAKLSTAVLQDVLGHMADLALELCLPHGNPSCGAQCNARAALVGMHSKAAGERCGQLCSFLVQEAAKPDRAQLVVALLWVMLDRRPPGYNGPAGGWWQWGSDCQELWGELVEQGLLQQVARFLSQEWGLPDEEDGLAGPRWFFSSEHPSWAGIGTRLCTGRLAWVLDPGSVSTHRARYWWLMLLSEVVRAADAAGSRRVKAQVVQQVLPGLQVVLSRGVRLVRTCCRHLPGSWWRS